MSAMDANASLANNFNSILFSPGLQLMPKRIFLKRVPAIDRFNFIQETFESPIGSTTAEYLMDGFS